MKRRAFFRHLAGGTAALAAAPTFVSGSWFSGPPTRETPLLIYGGGCAGLCAGIQAARMGTEVTILEPSPWIGGMLTAAGVSALDGNKHGAGGGLVQTFRERLAAHYGSMDALFTGWISLYCYEPHVGHRILQELVAPLDTLTILHGAEATRYERPDTDTRLVHVATSDGTAMDLACGIFIDATEYGDGLALAGLPYRLGRESRDELGEAPAPATPDLEMQDLTYAATLVRQPGAAPLPVTDVERAAWDAFACSTTLDCPNPDEQLLNHTVHDWESFITYAALPNDKVLLNWPHHANDFPVNVAFFEDRYYRRRHLQAAKLHTLQFITYLQHALGHPEWQIATDEYPTDDHLPPIPYLRESRRLVNDATLTMDAVVPVGEAPRAPWIPDSIAVGDYFIDHHHSKHHLPPDRRLVEDFPDNAPFQVPPSVFFTDRDERFLAGEKSIAVSHIVNGCTRLQPVVMLMGQALGVLAAQALRQDTAPASLAISGVQAALVDAGCPLYIMYDVPAGDPLFRPVQALALRGILRDAVPTELKRDAPMPADWARTWTTRAAMPDAIRQDAGPLRAESISTPLIDQVTARPDGIVTRGAFVQGLHAYVEAS